MKLFKTMVLLLVFLSILSIRPTFAQAPSRGINEYTPRELVHYFAEKYGVSEHQMSVTIQCESQWNPNAVGDHGKSFGLVQIYLPAHDITKEQALDPVYAVEFMAKEFKNGHKMWWTCYRLNFM